MVSDVDMQQLAKEASLLDYYEMKCEDLSEIGKNLLVGTILRLSLSGFKYHTSKVKKKSFSDLDYLRTISNDKFSQCRSLNFFINKIYPDAQVLNNSSVFKM
jgi:hypothetical protein